MKIDIRHNFPEVARAMRNHAKQVPFATARALTQVAQAVQAKMPGHARKVLDRPTPFTLAKVGTFVTRAEKANLTAVVGYKGRQASYLQWQAQGGRRTTKGIERKLQAIGMMPAGYVAVAGRHADVDAHGNIRRSQLDEMIGSLRTRLSVYRKRGKVMQKAGYFAVQPGDPSQLPAGIWMRRNDQHGGVLHCMLIFARAAQYRPRMQLNDMAVAVVNKEFGALFDRSFADALASAK